ESLYNRFERLEKYTEFQDNNISDTLASTRRTYKFLDNKNKIDNNFLFNYTVEDPEVHNIKNYFIEFKNKLKLLRKIIAVDRKYLFYRTKYELASEEDGLFETEKEERNIFRKKKRFFRIKKKFLR